MGTVTPFPPREWRENNWNPDSFWAKWEIIPFRKENLSLEKSRLITEILDFFKFKELDSSQIQTLHDFVDWLLISLTYDMSTWKWKYRRLDYSMRGYFTYCSKPSSRNMGVVNLHPWNEVHFFVFSSFLKWLEIFLNSINEVKETKSKTKNSIFTIIQNFFSKVDTVQIDGNVQNIQELAKAFLEQLGLYLENPRVKIPDIWNESSRMPAIQRIEDVPIPESLLEKK